MLDSGVRLSHQEFQQWGSNESRASYGYVQLSLVAVTVMVTACKPDMMAYATSLRGHGH